jgi:hypothetical protein
MKKILIFVVFIFAFMVSFIGCATTSENAAGKAMEYAGSVGPFVNPEIPIEQYGYIKTPSNPLSLLSIDGKKTHGGFITSGYHSLDVSYYVANTSVTTFHLNNNFESGKSYIVRYKISDDNRYDNEYMVTVFIEEINDPTEDEFEKLKTYLSFSKANPTYLEGSWTMSKRSPAIDIEITFFGNKFTMVTYNRMFKSTIKMEGRYLFSENTISLFHEKHNDEEKYMSEIVYYKLTENILNITNIKFGYLFKGQYTKKN